MHAPPAPVSGIQNSMSASVSDIIFLHCSQMSIFLIVMRKKQASQRQQKTNLITVSQRGNVFNQLKQDYICVSCSAVRVHKVTEASANVLPTVFVRKSN